MKNIYGETYFGQPGSLRSPLKDFEFFAEWRQREIFRHAESRKWYYRIRLGRKPKDGLYEYMDCATLFPRFEHLLESLFRDYSDILAETIEVCPNCGENLEEIIKNHLYKEDS